jgi:hypothetical protein
MLRTSKKKNDIPHPNFLTLSSQPFLPILTALYSNEIEKHKKWHFTNTLQLLLFGPKEVNAIFLNKQRLLFLPHNASQQFDNRKSIFNCMRTAI